MRRANGTTRAAQWVLIVVVATTASIAVAQKARRDAKVRWSRGAPLVSFGAADLATEKVRKELAGGLVKRFVMSVESRVEGSSARIATRSFECAVTYDLWDDGYLIRIGNITEQAPNLDAVVKRCLVVDGLGVGLPKQYDRHRGKRIYLSVRAEFNPISKRQCEELVRSSGGADAVGPIAVSIARRRLCAPEATLEFRSQTFVVPAP